MLPVLRALSMMPAMGHRPPSPRAGTASTKCGAVMPTRLNPYGLTLQADVLILFSSIPALAEATMSPVTLYDLAFSPRLIVGVECDHCIRRALLAAETVVGERRTLEEAGVRCAKCSSRKFTVTRFHTRSAVHALCGTSDRGEAQGK